MCTARSSTYHGGWAWTRSPSTSPLGVDLDQIPLNFPLRCGPGPDPPQLPPWVWAWKPARYAGTRHPPETGTPPGTRHPPGPGIPPPPGSGNSPHPGPGISPRDQAPPLGQGTHPGTGTPPPAGPDSPPPPREQNSWHMLLKILPCPKLPVLWLLIVKDSIIRLRFWFEALGTLGKWTE